MATPIINSVTLSPQSPVPAGQPVTITIDATDPDSKTVTVTVTVSDGDNQVVQVIPFGVVDALTYTVTTDSGTITATAQANVFTWNG